MRHWVFCTCNTIYNPCIHFEWFKLDDGKKKSDKKLTQIRVKMTNWLDTLLIRLDKRTRAHCMFVIGFFFVFVCVFLVHLWIFWYSVWHTNRFQSHNVVLESKFELLLFAMQSNVFLNVFLNYYRSEFRFFCIFLGIWRACSFLIRNQIQTKRNRWEKEKSIEFPFVGNSKLSDGWMRTVVRSKEVNCAVLFARKKKKKGNNIDKTGNNQ